MWILYDAGINLALFALRIYALFSPKTKFFLTQRKLHKQIPGNSTKPVICIHCASLGEFEMIVPLLSDGRLREKYSVVVSFFSPSGFIHAKTEDLVDAKIYLPFDTRREVRKFIKKLKPEVFVFVKYDLWFNLIKSLNTAGSKVVLVNALFRHNQFVLSGFATPFRKELAKFNQIFVQDDNSKKLLIDGNIPSEIIQITPDLRYDRVLEIRTNRNEVARIKEFKGDKPLLILGSSWSAEEDIVTAHLPWILNNYKVLIAPHDVSLTHISEIQSKFGEDKINLWSEQQNSSSQILIIDSIGVLSLAYQYGDIAFIGGGFGKGLHNILEAATFGMPIFCGPNIGKYPEALLLSQHDVLITISEEKEFGRIIGWLQQNDEIRDTIAEKSRKLVEESAGSGEKTLQFLLNL